MGARWGSLFVGVEGVKKSAGTLFAGKATIRDTNPCDHEAERCDFPEPKVSCTSAGRELVQVQVSTHPAAGPQNRM
jgi:hypothetical protein